MRTTLEQQMNYYAQAECAERLMQLEDNAMRLGRPAVAVLRRQAEEQRRDMHAFIAAWLLGIDYHDVLPLERIAVKNGLFLATYESSTPFFERR